MFSTATRAGKAFAAEQKLRESRKSIKAMGKKAVEKKINPYKIIKTSVDKMNSLSSAKYKQSPNEIERNSLNSEASKERFNFLRSKKLKEEKVRQEKFNRKICERKKLS